MTHAEIVGNIAIGIFLLILGAVSRPLFKRIWERMNQPSPLTPQTRAQLTVYIAMEEGRLERINYLDSHPRDLFQYLLQLLFGALVFSLSGVLILVASIFFTKGPYVQAGGLFLFIFLIFADILCLFGLIEAGRMSEKNIQKQKDAIQTRIDQLNKQLNPSE